MGWNQKQFRDSEETWVFVYPQSNTPLTGSETCKTHSWKFCLYNKSPHIYNIWDIIVKVWGLGNEQSYQDKGQVRLPLMLR